MAYINDILANYTNYILTAFLIALLLILVGATWKSPRSNLKLRESLFRNVGVPYRNLMP